MPLSAAGPAPGRRRTAAACHCQAVTVRRPPVTVQSTMRPGRTCRRRRGNDQPASRPWRTAPTSPPGGVFHRTAEPAPRAGPASQSTQPRAGSGGRTNPLRHRRLCTDSPSRTASHTRTAGPWDQSCPRPVAEPWRSDISERSCACAVMTMWLLLCAGHDATVDDDRPVNG